uniref:Uncharacterized protein n=1 Tax=Panagrolaimus superbus TaxID=310955 RepID=A0A914YML9_9BILA
MEESLKSIDDLLLILNKSSIALQNAKEIRKNVEADYQKAALLELKAKNESIKQDQLEETVRNIAIRMGSFEVVNDEILGEFEGMMDESQKALRKRITKKLKAQKEKYNLEKNRDDIKRDFLLLKKELQQLQNIYDSIPDKCFNHVRLEQSGQ